MLKQISVFHALLLKVILQGNSFRVYCNYFLRIILMLKRIYFILQGKSFNYNYPFLVKGKSFMLKVKYFRVN